MYSLEIERKPTPDQLTELMSAGIMLGKSQDRLIKSKKAENTRVILPEFVDEEPGKGELRLNKTYRYIGRISRGGFNRQKLWSMVLTEDGYTFDGSDMVDSYRINNIFRWTKDEVITSERKVFLLGEEDELGLDFIPEKVDDIMYQPDMLHAMSQFQFLSTIEVEDIMSSVNNYRNIASQYELSYNR